MADDPAANLSKILQSPSYRVAYKDVDFLALPEMRAARIELELLKPELYFQQNGIRSTIVVFGSTQIAEPAAAQCGSTRPQRDLAAVAERSAAAAGGGPGESLLERSRYYDAAREFGRLVSTAARTNRPATT